MGLETAVRQWFAGWEAGDYQTLPITAAFTHTSPFGTVEGRKAYLALVQANEAAFLGFRFDIHDELFGTDVACVRYTARKDDFALDASEWFFGTGDGINAIVSYYNVGDASYDNIE